jgi:NADPH:quinone reductase-like Zn-dependent oxidoreductase
LVKVIASTVNPTDVLMRSGLQAAAMAGLSPPYICGVEFAGIVHTLGGGSAELKIGQRVMGIVIARRPEGGAHAEFIRVPAASLVPVHDELDLTEAATIPMNGLTATMCLDALKLAPGRTILVTGGAGALGSYVIQMAKHAGLTVIADAKESDEALLRRFGADVIVPRGDTMAEAVRALHPNGVDGVVDGALLGDRAAAAVRDGGIGIVLRRTHSFSDHRVRPHYVAVFEQVANTPALIQLEKLFRDGIIVPRVAMRLPMSEAAEAHRLVARGGLRGRVVLMFSEPTAARSQ